MIARSLHHYQPTSGPVVHLRSIKKTFVVNSDPFFLNAHMIIITIIIITMR